MSIDSSCLHQEQRRRRGCYHIPTRSFYIQSSRFICHAGLSRKAINRSSGPACYFVRATSRKCHKLSGRTTRLITSWRRSVGCTSTYTFNWQFIHHESHILCHPRPLFPTMHVTDCSFDGCWKLESDHEDQTAVQAQRNRSSVDQESAPYDVRVIPYRADKIVKCHDRICGPYLYVGQWSIWSVFI